MKTEKIRIEIAIDLRGKSSRNPESLIPDMAKKLEISTPDVMTQIQLMEDLGYVSKANGGPSIRLTERGEIYYFSTKNQKIIHFLVNNWPNILSNIIAFLALCVSIYALLKVNLILVKIL
jgi:CTP-dependent riboflavin kinase